MPDSGLTVVHLSPRDLKEARIEGLSPIPFDRGLLQGTGTLESPVIESVVPFDDLVGSWSAHCPRGAAIEMEAQVRQGGKWSKWYRLPRWEPGAPRSFPRQADRNGCVEVDTLRLTRKADAFRYRLRMHSAGAREARLFQVAVAYEDTTRLPAHSGPFEPGPWVRELRIVPRSQMDEVEQYRNDVCSPTALSMVLEFWGIRRSTADVLEAVRDRSAGIYGNWTLNVAAAASWGLVGQVARLTSLRSLQDEIAAGHPIVVSISYDAGQLAGAPVRRTRGHLVVVSGFTPEGDVIVHDPAAPDRRSVRRVYRRRQFEKAWLLRKFGLAYMLAPRFPADLVVGIPTADLRTRPRLTRRFSAMDPARLSQLLYGERVRVLEARGDWVRVKALEQPHRMGSSWGPYPGWMKADALRMPPIPYRPNSVVRTKRAELRWQQSQGLAETLTLPLGSSLEARVGPGPRTSVRLLEGRTAVIHTSELVFAAAADPRLRALKPIDRRAIIETAALFLGDTYVWGGRSSYQRKPGWGVDCSGLTNLAYRSVGLLIPRDAEAQWRKSCPVRRRALQVGDLVFLTRSAQSPLITHVLLYAGSDGLLESSEAGGRTLRTTFLDRFGRALERIESGDMVTDRTKRSPFRRRIYFGGFLA
ncbi:MAG: hypothetical protein A2X36_14435 [Elusimicrobia bacterium GWA2_69_24]|nr:MAG: hypothetical protein A2X36_14435 [Elusimicrobia bacterium GWA2_69_24]HBL18410.1 hypothetical protein [Elusimicrobiota bacterium]